MCFVPAADGCGDLLNDVGSRAVSALSVYLDRAGAALWKDQGTEMGSFSVYGTSVRSALNHRLVSRLSAIMETAF